jgi:hypothetical protein
VADSASGSFVAAGFAAPDGAGNRSSTTVVPPATRRIRFTWSFLKSSTFFARWARSSLDGRSRS